MKKKIKAVETRTCDLFMMKFGKMSKINLLSVLISNCYHSRLKFYIQYLQCRLKSTPTLSNWIDLKRIFNKNFEKLFFWKTWVTIHYSEHRFGDSSKFFYWSFVKRFILAVRVVGGRPVDDALANLFKCKTRIFTTQ